MVRKRWGSKRSQREQVEVRERRHTRIRTHARTRPKTHIHARAVSTVHVILNPGIHGELSNDMSEERDINREMQIAGPSRGPEKPCVCARAKCVSRVTAKSGGSAYLRFLFLFFFLF